MLEDSKHSLNLWQKLAAITKEVGHIEKTGKNQHFNYAFIEHSNVVAICREIMFEYGVTLDLEVLDGQFVDNGGKTTRTVLNMRYHVTNADKPDENFNRLWFSEAMDQQDKGVNKALTAAEKNIFMKLYHISDVDLEADENDIQPPARKPAQPSRPAQVAAPAQMAQARPVTTPIPNPVANPVKDYFKVIGAATAACPKCAGPMEAVAGAKDGNPYKGERCIAKGCDFKRMLD